MNIEWPGTENIFYNFSCRTSISILFYSLLFIILFINFVLFILRCNKMTRNSSAALAMGARACPPIGWRRRALAKLLNIEHSAEWHSGPQIAIYALILERDSSVNSPLIKCDLEPLMTRRTRNGSLGTTESNTECQRELPNVSCKGHGISPFGISVASKRQTIARVTPLHHSSSVPE